MTATQKREIPMWDKLTPVGRAIYMTRSGRFYHDGCGGGFVWRWWHPLSWILAPILFLILCLMVGVPEAWLDRHEIGLRMKPWFVTHPDRLEWE